jgi:hypothetical protein
MSWRRFLILLRGLSPNSATVAKLQSTSYLGSKKEHVNEVVGAKAAQAAFDAIIPPSPSEKAAARALE